MRESKVEAHLVECVEACGGACEKFKSPNRRNVPDRIVSWPENLGLEGAILELAECVFVECKATGEKPTPGQLRDHERRRKMGFRVYVVDSYESVDNFLRSEGKIQ